MDKFGDTFRYLVGEPIEWKIMTDDNIKQQVREFYDQVGWQEVSEGLYQNARYEDLRPVSREYIHQCHLRVNRHLQPLDSICWMPVLVRSNTRNT